MFIKEFIILKKNIYLIIERAKSEVLKLNDFSLDKHSKKSKGKPHQFF